MPVRHLQRPAGAGHAHQQGALELLLPYIDTALRQIAHLPRQRSDRDDEASTEPAAAEGSDEYGLSMREREIMDWVRKGKTNQEIGTILDISAFTVKNHLQRIFKSSASSTGPRPSRATNRPKPNVRN